MSDNQRGTASETMVRDLTTGSVPGLLFSFAAPLFAANALQAVYNLVDMVVVGQVKGGAEKKDRVIKTVAAVTAVSLAFGTAFSALVLLFPEEVCSFFTGDPEVLAKDALIILPIVLNSYGAATRAPAFAFINGSGNSRINLLVAV